MSLKKIEEKNPGWQFTKKISKKASKTVVDAATQSNLDPETYNLKYAKQVKSKKAVADAVQPKLNDKQWKMMKKESKIKSTDLLGAETYDGGRHALETGIAGNFLSGYQPDV